MAFSSISAKTTFAPHFDRIVNGTNGNSEKTQILAAMKTAYEIEFVQFDDRQSTGTKEILSIKASWCVMLRSNTPYDLYFARA